MESRYTGFTLYGDCCIILETFGITDFEMLAHVEGELLATV